MTHQRPIAFAPARPPGQNGGMPDRLRYPILVGLAATFIANYLLMRSGAGAEGWVVTAVVNAGLTAVVVGWLIADRWSKVKPPKDGPKADYHDADPAA